MDVRDELHEALDVEDFPSRALLAQTMAGLGRPPARRIPAAPAVAAGLIATALVLISAAAIPVDFTYDPAGRLISADYGAGKSISYAYDNAGNLVLLSQPAPAIIVGSLVGNQLTLSWPASPAGFILETSLTIGAGAAWSTNVGAAPMANGDLLTVTLPVSATTQFYRLRKP